MTPTGAVRLDRLGEFFNEENKKTYDTEFTRLARYAREADEQEDDAAFVRRWLAENYDPNAKVWTNTDWFLSWLNKHEIPYDFGDWFDREYFDSLIYLDNQNVGDIKSYLYRKPETLGAYAEYIQPTIDVKEKHGNYSRVFKVTDFWAASAKMTHDELALEWAFRHVESKHYGR